METLGDRITRLRKAQGLSQTALGLLCGWENGQARIGNYERGTREPSIGDLRLIARALGVNLITIIDGENPNAIAENQDRYGYSPAIQDYALIPQYSVQGAAGNGQMNDHVEITGGLVFKRAWLSRMHLREQNLHVIYVCGHSMEPTVSDADVVLIDQSQTAPRDGRIFVIRKPDGELIIKRLIQSITGGWLIRSDNDDKRTYPDQPITENDIDSLQIVGRVVWHGGAL